MKNPKLVGPGARTRDVDVPAEPSLGRDIQTKIGQQLRAMYDDVVTRVFRPALSISWTVSKSGTTKGHKGDKGPTREFRSIGARGRLGGGSEPACVRHFAQRECRPRRRSRTGNPVARPRQHRLVPARDQHVSMAVHDSAQSVSLRIPQAPT